jgi:Uma2 family endonuclease
MILSPPTTRFETDKAGQIIYPVDNGEPLSNDTEHFQWITFVLQGLVDWLSGRREAFITGDVLWYPVEGRPDICKAPDVMVVLDHPDGPRSSYKQWEENNRPPQVVFEFLSKSNTVPEMMDKLDFYSDFGCEEFYTYDYQRGTFVAFQQLEGSKGLTKMKPGKDSTWHSPLLDVTFGLDAKGKLWVRRGDGMLVESHRQIVQKAEAEAKRAEAEAKRAEALAQKLRELGVDPDSL